MSVDSLMTPLRFLPVSPFQVSLPAVLRCGQSFRWKKSAFILRGKPVAEWSIGYDDRTIVLRQDAQGIHYVSLYPPSSSAIHEQDVRNDTTLPILRRYFTLDHCLVDLYRGWTERDPNFRKKTMDGRFGGVRVLRQPAWETLVSFICSSNNNIPRITLMIDRLCSKFGTNLPDPPLGCTVPPESRSSIQPLPLEVTPQGPTPIYSFPPPSHLTGSDLPSVLRELGFGYRAEYVHKTALRVCQLPTEQPATPSTSSTSKDPAIEFLESLSKLSMEEAKEVLLSFTGVGPKVADCILLMGLGFGEVVPVDTHVWQIAVRDYAFRHPSCPSTAKGPVSKIVYEKVKEKLRSVWGPMAGWAHQVLFTADLRSFQDFQDPHLIVKTEEAHLVLKTEEGETTTHTESATVVTEEVRTVKLEETADVDAIVRTPTSKARKRRRGASQSVSSEDPPTPATEDYQRPPLPFNPYPSPAATPLSDRTAWVPPDEKTCYTTGSIEGIDGSLAERVKRRRRGQLSPT